MSIEIAIRAAVAAEVAPLAAEVRELRELLASTRNAPDEVGGLRELTAWLGNRSIAATKAQVHRDPELAQLASRVGRVRRWRRGAVLAWLEARRHPRAPRLRAVKASHP